MVTILWLPPMWSRLKKVKLTTCVSWNDAIMLFIQLKVHKAEMVLLFLLTCFIFSFKMKPVYGRRAELRELQQISAKVQLQHNWNFFMYRLQLFVITYPFMFESVELEFLMINLLDPTHKLSKNVPFHYLKSCYSF